MSVTSQEYEAIEATARDRVGSGALWWRFGRDDASR